MSQSRAEPDLERHKTLRFFMVVCVIIAMIAAATGLANAKFNADVIRKLEITNKEQADEIKNIKDNFEKYRSQVAEKINQYEAERTKNREVAESLSLVLQQKEVAALESSASPEIQRHIAMWSMG